MDEFSDYWQEPEHTVVPPEHPKHVHQLTYLLSMQEPECFQLPRLVNIQLTITFLVNYLGKRDLGSEYTCFLTLRTHLTVS